MGVVRYLFRLLVGVWVGGLLCFGAIVAPALFQVLTPEQAAHVVRRVLPAIDAYALVAGGLLLILAFVHDGVPRSWPQRIRAVLLIGMTACAALSAGWVTPEMDELRTRANDSISSLPREDPIRREFGKLHGVSSALALAELLAGLVVLALAPGPRRSTSAG
ncbi:MAG: DUF4149 domain-containing protein [Myxococcaceae bacterium]|nr:DUF4149 domain-containing protein [Myxococcaceae bacterium]